MKTFTLHVRRIVALCALLAGTSALAQSRLVISQVYGSGSGATYNAKYVELYNASSAAIPLTGYSLQYGSAAGTAGFGGSGNLLALSGTINAGHYFLIQLSTAGSSGAALPTPDQSGTSPTISGSAGQLVLVNGTTALTADTTCAAKLADTKIVDFIGYGSTATCYPGYGTSGYSYAPGLTSTTADDRTNPTTNSGNNSVDFTSIAPAPHNSSYVASGSGTTTMLSVTGSASPNPVTAGNAVTLTATVTPATSPASTGITVTGNLTSIGGSASTAFTAGANNTFTTTATVTNSGSGTVTVPISASDAQSDSASGTISFTVNQPVPFVAIDVIQGQKSTTAMTTSSYAGKQVTTSGVVTTVISNGFFIQTPDAQADSNALTPEGIEIFTSSKPTVAIGNLVQVTGMVQTYPAVTASHTPATEITSPTITVQQTSVALPAAITLTASMLTPGGGLYQLTPYEGMRVSVPSLTTTSGTDGNLTESTETITSNGQFYAIITGTYGNTGQTRPFREPGIDIRDSFTPQPSNVAHFDDNPERILVDSQLAGGTAIDLSTGAVLANVTGVLDFTYSSDTYYDPSRLILDASYSASNVTPGYTVTTYPVPTKASNEFTVASYNIERFYNTVSSDDTYAVPQGVSCFSGDASKGTNLCTSEAVDITQAAYTRRLQKLSLAIRTVLNSPDVVTLEEVENQSVANDIATQLNSDIQTATGTAGQYVALSTDNNTYYTQDGTGISVGILYNAATVDNLGFVQYGQGETFTPSTNTLTTLNDRPWLVLSAGLKRANAKDYPVTVIVNHMKSLINQNSQTSNSTRLKKELQAEDIAKYIQNLQTNGAHVISGGDFNAFEFSDGYNDTLATYTNTNVLPSNQVVQPGVAGLVTPALTDLALTLPAAQRWSYQEDGSAQILDHMVVTPELVSNGAHFAYGHNNADFALTNYNNAANAARTSDHDPAIGYFVLPAPVLAATLTPASLSFGTVVINNSSSGQAFTFTNAGEGAITINGITATGDYAVTSNCGSTLAINSSCTGNVVFTPTASGTRTGTLTVATNVSGSTFTTSLTGTGRTYTTPVGNLDLAVDNAYATSTVYTGDLLYVSGWAADPVDGSPIAVTISIDGTNYTPTTGVSRSDVANASNNQAYANSGFVFSLPASSLAIGNHTVTAYAANSIGVVRYFETLTITVAAPKAPAGNLDLAVDNVTGQTTVSQRDLLYVAGWAADYQANGNVASVTIVVDGSAIGNAMLNQSRPDVASASNDPSWSNTGFVAAPSAANLSLGNHSVSVYAIDHGGRVSYFETINITVIP